MGGNVIAAIAAVLLGLLGLLTFWWFPTAGILFGLLGAATGFFGRRRLAVGVGDHTTVESWTTFGTMLGAAAVVGSVLIVVLTTT